MCGREDAVALANGDDLIRFDFREPFDLLRRWPLDFDDIDDIRHAYSKMEPQVSLRHHT